MTRAGRPAPTIGPGTGSKAGIHRPGVAVWREYVGNEDVPKIIRSSQVSNRRISNVEDDVGGETVGSPPLPQLVQLIPKPKIPVPSPLKAPVSAINDRPTNGKFCIDGDVR